MSNLTAALRAANEGGGLHRVPARLEAVIQALEKDTNIHPLMRADLITLITSTTSLAESVADDSYPVDIVTDTVATLLTVSSAILAHVTHNRPSYYGYGIEDLKTKTLLDSIFHTKTEADREITNLKNLGATSRLRVVPVRISSQIVNRPDFLQPPTLELTSVEPEVPKSDPNISKQLSELTNSTASAAKASGKSNPTS